MEAVLDSRSYLIDASGQDVRGRLSDFDALHYSSDLHSSFDISRDSELLHFQPLAWGRGGVGEIKGIVYHTGPLEQRPRRLTSLRTTGPDLVSHGPAGSGALLRFAVQPVVTGSRCRVDAYCLDPSAFAPFVTASEMLGRFAEYATAVERDFNGLVTVDLPVEVPKVLNGPNEAGDALGTEPRTGEECSKCTDLREKSYRRYKAIWDAIQHEAGQPGHGWNYLDLKALIKARTPGVKIPSRRTLGRMILQGQCGRLNQPWPASPSS